MKEHTRRQDLQFIDEHWRNLLIGIAILVESISVSRVLMRPGGPEINIDAAVFQHAGWYITQGAVPYVHFWDPKPPVVFETTAILSLLAGGDMLYLHLLSVFTTAAAAVGITLAVGVLTFELTEDGIASLLAGVTVLTLAGFHFLPAFGFRPKYFSIAFGLVSLIFFLKQRPLVAALFAGLTPGFWQFGIIFPILGVGITFKACGWEGAKRAIIGIFVVGSLALVPIIISNAFIPMLVEVVLAPVYASESQTLAERLANGVFELGYVTIPVLIGSYGLIRAGKMDIFKTWWVLTGASFAVVQILFLDFDSYADLYLGLVFVAIGLGLFASNITSRGRTTLTACLGVLLVVSVFMLGGAGIFVDPVTAPQRDSTSPRTVLQDVIFGAKHAIGYQSSAEVSTEHGDVTQSPYGKDSMTQIYWGKVKPESCHYRLSEMEVAWIERTGGEYMQKKCGRLPPDEIV